MINNAGIGIAGAIEDTTAAEAQAQFETNFFGTHRVCRAVLPHLRAQRAGVIINMSSLAGRIAVPFQGFYSATKFAIEAYSEALRMEVRPFGIAVSMIEPGNSRPPSPRTGASPRAAFPPRPTTTRWHGQSQSWRAASQANHDLSPVIGAVETILESRRPALRYPRAPAVQRTFNALRPLLPQAVPEFLIRDTYGLKKS